MSNSLLFWLIVGGNVSIAFVVWLFSTGKLDSGSLLAGHGDKVKSLLGIAVALLLINLVCRSVPGWDWWQAGFASQGFFWLAQIVILYMCYSFANIKHAMNTVAVLGAFGLVVWGWITVAHDYIPPELEGQVQVRHGSTADAIDPQDPNVILCLANQPSRLFSLKNRSMTGYPIGEQITVTPYQGLPTPVTFSQKVVSTTWDVISVTTPRDCIIRLGPPVGPPVQLHQPAG